MQEIGESTANWAIEVTKTIIRLYLFHNVEGK